jgi:Asp-tRNA(Asn)/Glu-tRNA(Gln) amidotransferase A subunit family amidase
VHDAPEPTKPRLFDALDYSVDLSGPQVCRAIETALRNLSAAGAMRTQHSLPPSVEKVEQLWHDIAAYEASATLPPLVEGVSGYPRVESLIADGRRIDAAGYRNALALRAQITAELEALLAECDAVVMPAAGEVPKFGSMGDAHFLRPWSLGGFPSITIPVGFDASGLPMGMQLVAKRGDDAKLVALACWSETHLA